MSEIKRYTSYVKAQNVPLSINGNKFQVNFHLMGRINCKKECVTIKKTVMKEDWQDELYK
jgi:hypothetical protein